MIITVSSPYFFFWINLRLSRNKSTCYWNRNKITFSSCQDFNPNLFEKSSKTFKVILQSNQDWCLEVFISEASCHEQAWLLIFYAWSDDNFTTRKCQFSIVATLMLHSCYWLNDYFDHATGTLATAVVSTVHGDKNDTNTFLDICFDTNGVVS